MMQVRIPDEIRSKPIDWLDRSPEIMEYLHNMGLKTVEDAIERKHEIPEKYWHECKKKMILNI